MRAALIRPLLPHVSTPPGFPCEIHVEIGLGHDGTLALTYRIGADPARLRIPPVGVPERADGLWRHTCCELFAAGAGEAYREFNFSPSGQWQAYLFHGYRDGGPLPNPVAPTLLTTLDSTGLVLSVRLPAGNLSGRPARLGITVVLEDAAGGLSFWALAHAADKPDFHDPATFTLMPEPDSPTHENRP